MNKVRQVNDLQIHVRDGLSQPARQLAALEKNYFNVDEMRFEQLLTQTQDYAKLIKFQSLHKTRNKTNHRLFSDDEIMVMAHIMSINLTQLEANFERRLSQEAGSSDWALQDQQTTSPIGLARLLDSWLISLRHPQSNAGENLYNLIESIIIGLSKELYTLNENMPSRDELANLFSRHFLELITPAISVTDTYDTLFNHENNFDLRSIYAALLKAIDMIQGTAQRLLPESMACQHHDPAAALRIVFVELYKKLQHKVNHFTLNYIDFYYQQVLQAQLTPQHPDSVYLIMQLSPQQKAVELPKGTQFLAGMDKNSQDIIYASDSTVELNDAVVAQLNTLYFPRQTLSHIKTEDAPPALVDAAWLDNIPTLPNGTKKERDKMRYYPLLGAPRGGQLSASTTEARIGFAIASNVLLLREGKRKINVTLQYDNSKSQVSTTLEEVLAQLPDLKQNTQHQSPGNTRSKAKFFAYFGRIFTLGLTTAQGWLDIEDYKPAYSETDSSLKENCLSISFYLPEDAPAITAYSADIHGENYSTAVPVLRFILKDNHFQYPYDLLRHLVLREVRIHVSAEGCHDLILHNNLGQLSPLSPFTPFGPLPSIGSYFIVGHEETRTKQLTRFDVNIEWNNLPACSGGFGTWYQAYENEKDNSKFVVSASVLADGKWLPNDLTNNQHQELFASHIKNGQLNLLAHKKLSAAKAIPYYKAQDNQQARKPFTYTPATKAGLFKFMLQGPIGGFGHQEYQTLLTNTLTYNARVKSPQLFKVLPNPPYTPEIAAISLDYAAVSIMTLADTGRQDEQEFRDQFFHLHPLGWEAISPLRHPKIFQLPQFDSAGSLLIGITASEIQQLNLFFHLRNDSLPTKPMLKELLDVVDDVDNNVADHLENDTSPRENYFHRISGASSLIRWSYMCDNQWRAIEPKYILGDSTNGFMRSGIVTLAPLKGITSDNTRMPQGMYWLKISADTQLTHFSHLYSVYTQAVKATWQSGQHPLSEPPMVLPADTIQRTRQTLPGITGVAQICESFDGVPTETQHHLRTRISERLRHKNRALTPLDYEMLILEKFPQVYKVKCFANVRTDKTPTICPGNLLIVPVPHLSETNARNYQVHFDGYLILAIKEFVQQLAPPFVTISIENPVYEEIQVRCAVHLKKGFHPGHYHNVLNQALCDFLSPWNPVGNNVHFGWNLSEQEIKSFIHNLEYIDFVTDFSLLRIAPSVDGLYTLNDTAAVKTSSTEKIKPSYLWSIAVPIKNHYIETTGDNKAITAEVTGYDELEVGSTFIIS